MIIQNTSKIRLPTVRALLRFAAAHSPADLTLVCVNVKNAGTAICGRAYAEVPAMSNAPPEARHLVVLRVRTDESYPCTNMVRRWRWGPIRTWDEYCAAIAGDPNDARNWRGVVHQAGVVTHGMQRGYWQTMPYGGKGSPLIEYADWQEQVVCLMVHEFQHIWQFQHPGMPCSEIACERAAAYALKEWRAMRVAAVSC